MMTWLWTPRPDLAALFLLCAVAAHLVRAVFDYASRRVTQFHPAHTDNVAPEHGAVHSNNVGEVQ